MEKISESVRPLLVGMTTGLVTGILVLDVMLPLGLAGMLYVALVMVSLWSPKHTFTLTVAGACTALILLDYLMPRRPARLLWLLRIGVLPCLPFGRRPFFRSCGHATKRTSRFCGVCCRSVRHAKKFGMKKAFGIN
jgi:hypothetical protein